MAATITTTPAHADARTDTPRVDPDMPGAFAYEHCDIPEGMTIVEHRRARAHRHARRHRDWLRRHQTQQTPD